MSHILYQNNPFPFLFLFIYWMMPRAFFIRIRCNGQWTNMVIKDSIERQLSTTMQFNLEKYFIRHLRCCNSHNNNDNNNNCPWRKMYQVDEECQQFVTVFDLHIDHTHLSCHFRWGGYRIKILPNAKCRMQLKRYREKYKF